MANSSLPLPSPDFNTLKNSLKSFLSNQDELKDFDFDGAALNVLLDVLAYNSHLNAFWLNMVANESFLSTAIKRNNVVSAAKNIGYRPRSAKSAYTDLYVEYTPETGVQIQNSIIIPAGTIFMASSNAKAYTFNLLDDTIAEYDATKNAYVAEKIRVFEGKFMIHEFTVVSSVSLTDIDTTDDVVLSGVSIPNINVDSDSIVVMVQDTSISTDYLNYSLYDNSLNIDENSRIYFLGEDEFGYTKITFGDGLLGHKPAIGSKIKVMYLISSGNGPNGIGLLNQAASIPGANISIIRPHYPVGGGSFPESVDSIKYNAQLGFESQGRGVISDDFIYLTKQAYPNAKAVIAWGGQDNNPPQYGKVFISVQPNNGLILTENEKQLIIDFIKSKAIITIKPVIVEPDYLFVDTDTYVYYDKSQATLIGGKLESAIKDVIKNYSDTKLNTFFNNLEYSKLLTRIDNTDLGIISNTTTIKLNKRIYVTNNNPSDNEVFFGVKLVKGSLTSTPFSYSSFKNCLFEERGDKLVITSLINGVRSVVLSDAGRIDYDTGIVTLNAIKLEPDKIFYSQMNQLYYVKLYATPEFNSIKVKNNQILSIENINVFAKES